MHIRKANSADQTWIYTESEPVGGPKIVSNRVMHTLADYPAIVAVDGNSRCGYAVYRFTQDTCELLAIRALNQWHGVGTLLLQAVEDICRTQDCGRIWLCTTNDNLPALRFYQRRGYRLAELHVGAFANVLALKGFDPATEVIGIDGVPITDELLLDKTLS